MAATPYSSANQKFSDAAHQAAQSEIYPFVFPIGPPSQIDSVEFVSTSLSMGDRERIFDGEMAIDRIVKVNNRRLKGPVEFTVQERFRHVEFLGFKDITITVWNNRSNLKSELHKLNAGLMVYGYFNERNGQFNDWVVVQVALLVHAIVNGNISYEEKTNPRSQQTFITIKFASLEKIGAILCSMSRTVEIRKAA